MCACLVLSRLAGKRIVELESLRAHRRDRGRVNDVRRAPSGGVARFKVSSSRLSQAIVGGVAINDAGETLGIVDGLEGGQATVLPAESIRRAAQRVLERQASVPKPWLGVRGEAVSDLKVEQIRVHGWIPERAGARLRSSWHPRDCNHPRQSGSQGGIACGRRHS